MAVISLAGVGISTAFCESSGVNFFFVCVYLLPVFYQVVTPCGSV